MRSGKGDKRQFFDQLNQTFTLIRAAAPGPLPKGAKWWFKIEKPNGTKAVRSIPLPKDIKKGGSNKIET